MRESLDAEAIALLRQSRLSVGEVWQRLAPYGPSPKIAATVQELKTSLGSEQFIDSLDEIAKRTTAVLDAYKHAYIDLFERRKKAYESAIEEIRNRSEWGQLEATNPEIASSLLLSLSGRVGTDEDTNAVANGTSLGKASLTEMESDLCAVDGLRSSVLVKLQELSIGAEKKAPVRKVRVSELFNRPIQTKADLDKALDLIRDSLQKFIDEGAIIILE
jgi:hypothetical protein